MAVTRPIATTGENWHDSLCNSVAYDDRPIKWTVTVDVDNVGGVANYGAPNSACAAAIAQCIADLAKICAFAPLNVVSVVDVFTDSDIYYALGNPGSGNFGSSEGPGGISRVVFSNTDFGTAFNTLVRGDAYWQTVYHETGHECGMKHTYGTDAGNPVMDASLSVRYNTVMTNRDYLGSSGGHTAEQYGRMANWGYLDIQWLVMEYDGVGPGEGVDCTYTFTAGVPAVNGTPRTARPTGKVFEQLLGCTGLAKFDLSGHTTSMSLNLNYGGWCRLNTASDATLVDLLISAPGTQLAPGNFRIWPNVGWSLPSYLVAGSANDTIGFPVSGTENTLELADNFAVCSCAGSGRNWTITTATQGVKTVSAVDYVDFNGDLKPVSELGVVVQRILWTV